MLLLTRILPLLALLALPLTGTVGADCAPPCGPIPVYIEIASEKKNFQFDGADEYVVEAIVSAYIDADKDGFYYDPENLPELSLRVNKQPPWVKTTLEPDHFVIPVNDPQYVSQDGSPDQVRFYWEAPLTITVQRLRDPTLEEISKEARFVRPDGTYRILTSGASTSSLVAPEVFGPNMGLQEGYGVKELRFVPEIDGVAYKFDESGQPVPAEEGASLPDAKGAASAPVAAMTGLLVGAIAILRRRRH